MIHPTAVIHPQARLDSSVEVGPYSVIDPQVEVGAGCIVGPHVYLTGVTKIGSNNRFHAGCVIGDSPQDLKYKGEPTRLVIGDRNVFREHVTINRSTTMDSDTEVGSDNLLMAGTHVAHNCRVGNYVIMANTSMLGGHVTVEDRALISGSCLVHQFCRIGTLAMMQGGSAVSQDVAPFTVARGVNGIAGLNVVGLRRAGFSAADRLELKKLYHLLFRSGKRMSDAVAEGREKFLTPGARTLLDFVTTSKRGIASRGRKATKEEE